MHEAKYTSSLDPCSSNSDSSSSQPVDQAMNEATAKTPATAEVASLMDVAINDTEATMDPGIEIATIKELVQYVRGLLNASQQTWETIDNGVMGYMRHCSRLGGSMKSQGDRHRERLWCRLEIHSFWIHETCDTQPQVNCSALSAVIGLMLKLKLEEMVEIMGKTGAQAQNFERARDVMTRVVERAKPFPYIYTC